MNRGFKPVSDCIEDAELGQWPYRLLMDEIIPVLADRVADPEGFARVTLDAFSDTVILLTIH